MSEGLFASLYARREPFALIDTRERRPFVDGQWFGSINVPLSVLTRQITRLVPDRAFPIHLLDWQDDASQMAAERLKKLGYANVTRCKTERPEGFGAGFVQGEFVWSKAFGEVVAHQVDLPELTPAEYLADHADALLFDVRPTAEYQQFTIPSSQSLPNSLMLGNMEALKATGEMALLHCAGRTRSIIGACTLKAAGYDGPYAIFRGGTQAWQLDGHEREFNAQRLFAGEAADPAPVHAFLRRWGIRHQRVAASDLASFVESNSAALLFDVSNDAAKGEMAAHGIMRISGTNLVQQTDRSIARFHVPVILLDQGSGSRAAFAAYWLGTMGFQVQVVYLDGALEAGQQPQEDVQQAASPFEVLGAQRLEDHLASGGLALDFRASSAYQTGHAKGSQWWNIGALLSGDQPEESEAGPVAIVGEDIAHATEVAVILKARDWPIAGVFAWQTTVLDPTQIAEGELVSPIDQSALFAGRHHGNMQDSRDYLAWEEELPDQIEHEILEGWTALLGRSPHA